MVLDEELLRYFKGVWYILTNYFEIFWEVGYILTNYFEIFLGGRVNLDELL